VFRLPSTCFAEENGALVNSARWLQWHWKGANPPGEARSDLDIMAGIFNAHARDVRQGRRRLSGSDSQLDLEIMRKSRVPAGRARQRIFGQRPQRLGRSQGPDQDHAQGRRAARGLSPSCANDGSTQSGCWIFCGAWGPTGNLMARRDNSIPRAWPDGQLGLVWPANRRVLYNRASCDPTGKPYTRSQVDRMEWYCLERGDVPDFKADENPAGGRARSFMNPEGVARFFAARRHGGGPVPPSTTAVRDTASATTH